MTADGHRPIPLWATNRGLLVMVRMALSQQGRVTLPAGSLAEFRKALDEARPRVVIVAAEDVALAGLDPILLERLVGDGTAVVLLSSARPLPEPPGPRTRVLPVPFTARDLLEALPAIAAPEGSARTVFEPHQAAAFAPAAVPASPLPAPAPAPEILAEAVQREVERVVAELARPLIEELARRLVPELAEAIIRAELNRVLKESEDAVLAEPAAPDDDR